MDPLPKVDRELLLNLDRQYVLMPEFQRLLRLALREGLLDGASQETFSRLSLPEPEGAKGGLDDGCMGRSRGGLTTKIHAVVDAEGRPIALDLTAGQTHDGQMALPLLGTMREGTIVLADKAYDSNALRAAAEEKKAWANIPAKKNRKDSFAFSGWVYRQRNVVERFFNKLKQFRGIATRYDKNPRNFLAAVKIVATRIWIKAL